MRAKQDREVLIIKSDSNYAEVIFHTFFLVLLCYIAMIIAISRKQLAIWQFISCLIVFTVSLRNIVDVPLFWKLEISRTPNKCVVTRRKLLSWETTTIDGFTDLLISDMLKAGMDTYV